MANKVIYGQLRLDNLKEYIQTGTKKDGTAYKYIPVKIVKNKSLTNGAIPITFSWTLTTYQTSPKRMSISAT